MVFHPQGEWFVNPAFLVWYLFDVCCWERLGMAWDGDVFCCDKGEQHIHSHYNGELV